MNRCEEQSSLKVAFLNLCRQRTMGLLETLDTDSGSLNHGWIARDLVRDAHTAAAPHMTKELLVCSLAASEPCVEGRKSFFLGDCWTWRE